MLEPEAKTKWCPFVRHISDLDDHASSNRGTEIQDEHNKGYGNPEYSRCIGSKCMAWRWEKNPVFMHEETPGGAGAGQLVYAQHLNGLPSDIEGYCGLGGKP